MTSLLRTDTGNFNKFLTSLGLGLLVAAIAVPYFFLRDTGTLRVTRHELTTLTATGRETIERRQRRSADIEVPVLIISGCVFLSGCAALFVGGRRLLAAQRKEDAAVDRQAQRENYEIREQTAAEVDEDRNAQALEDVVASRRSRRSREQEKESGAAPSQESVAVPSKDSTQPEDGSENEAPVVSVSTDTLVRTRLDIARIEEAAQATLREGAFQNFDFLSEVTIGSGSAVKRYLRLDGLFQANQLGQADVALEMKVSTISTDLLPLRSVNFVDPLLGRVSRYHSLTDRQVIAWLVIVVAQKVSWNTDREEWRGIKKNLESLMAGQGRCTILAEKELNDLPNRFRQIFDP